MNRRLAFLVTLLPGLLPLAAQPTGHWDGRFWMAEVATPKKLTVAGNDRLLITGGSLSFFNPAAMPNASVASWDGQRWTYITNRQPSAMVAAGSLVWFAGGSGSNLVTRLDTDHDPVNLPTVEGRILTLALDGSNLLAGGEFVAGTEHGATNVARWDGTAWTPLGNGVPGVVDKLLVSEGGVFAGVSATPEKPATVWQWDGAAWTPLGAMSDDPKAKISDLTLHAGKLIAAIGTITSTTNAAVLAWSGGQWVPYGEPTLTGSANSLAVFHGELHVAGASFKLDGVTTPFFGAGRLVDGQWQRLEFAPGQSHTLALALAATEDELFMLSQLPTSLGVSSGKTFGLWQFDGHDWWLHSNGLFPFFEVTDIEASPLGVILAASGGLATNPGRNGFLWDGFFLKALAVIPPEPGVTLSVKNRMIATGTRLYRQAVRSPAAPEGANLLARLEGTNWIAATTPITLDMQSATALAAEGETIYVSGRDAAFPGSPVAVARWQDGSWKQLGGHFANGALQALAAFNGQLLAGGSFKNVDDQPVSNLARWDGTAWLPVTPAPDGPITGFAKWGNDLVVIGGFTNVGNVISRGVALWNGTGWQPLAAGLGLAIPSAVAVNDEGTIAVGGKINGSSSEVWLRHGVTWERIGTGNGGNTLNALLWQGSDLYVGGGFIDIGNVQSDIFAIWHEPSPQITLHRSPEQGYRIGQTGAKAGGLILERGSSPDQLAPRLTNSPLSLRRTFLDLPAEASAQGFYRIRTEE